MGIGAGLGGNYVGIMAFAGAFCISMVVIGLANIGGRANSVKLLLVGSALSAVCGAFSNFIIYVSNSVVPHGVRLLLGTDHRKLIPVSALAGAVFLVWADAFCRIILPGNEMPIGILTSMLGAPVFIFLMVQKTYGFGGND